MRLARGNRSECQKKDLPLPTGKPPTHEAISRVEDITMSGYAVRQLPCEVVGLEDPGENLAAIVERITELPRFGTLG